MARFIDAGDAVRTVTSGQTVMVGGFGLVGQPVELLELLSSAPVRDLTVISNNIGEPGRGLGLLLERQMVRRAVGSYFTSNPRVIEEFQAGRIELELVPQGTLAESIRCGGAGIPAFFTPTSADTALGTDKETREFEGRQYVMERALRADVALIRGHRSDRLGNLSYYKTARNFNPVMATAADVVVAQVDEVVECHSSLEEIVTPHVYVDYVTVCGSTS